MAVAKVTEHKETPMPNTVKVSVRPTSLNDSRMIFVSDGNQERRFMADTPQVLPRSLVDILEGSTYINRNMVEGNPGEGNAIGVKMIASKQNRFVVNYL